MSNHENPCLLAARIQVYCEFMSVAEVRSLPLREKLQIFEAIWDDLSARVEQMEVSKVERELLDSRLERIRKGEVQIHEWDAVKHSIGKR